MTAPAINSFVANVGVIEKQLKAIGELAANHFETLPDSVTWGDVGSTDLVCQHLADILTHYNKPFIAK